MRPAHLLLPLCLLVAAPAPAEPAPRVWRALSGDRMELDGRRLALSGVRCPDPQTARGRRAKALLNTFLRGTRHGGPITCRITAGDMAECRRQGRTASGVLLASGLCEARDLEQGDAPEGDPLTLHHPQREAGPVSYWRLRLCAQGRPGAPPLQCGVLTPEERLQDPMGPWPRDR